MGMYDNIMIDCIKCGGPAMAQIKVLDCLLKTYDLTNLNRLSVELSEADIRRLRSGLTNKWFDCRCCNNSFQPFPDKSKTPEQKYQLVKKLFERGN